MNHGEDCQLSWVELRVRGPVEAPMRRYDSLEASMCFRLTVAEGRTQEQFVVRDAR